MQPIVLSNLPPGSLLARLVCGGYAIAMGCSFPLGFLPAARVIELYAFPTGHAPGAFRWRKNACRATTVSLLALAGAADTCTGSSASLPASECQAWLEVSAF